MGRHMEELEYMLCDELDKIAQRGELTAGTLDTVQKLTHSLKSIKTIEAMDDSGYSGGMYPMHESGNSYARGRGSYMNRDSMGRYSRNGGYSGRGYSRDGEKDHMLNKIEELRQSVEKMEE